MGTLGSEGPGVGVSPQGAAELLVEGAVLVDVREVHEWEAGNVLGAWHLPLNGVSDRSGDLPHDRRVVVVCRSRRRSAGITELLIQAGFDAVNLDGGLLAWVETGLPLATDDGNHGQVA